MSFFFDIRRMRPFLLLAALVFLAYAPSLRNGFINLDDPLLITENPLVLSLTPQTVRQAFTTYDPELYIPFTLLSYQAEVALFGVHPLVFHLTNLLLHIANTCFFFVLARRLLSSRDIAWIVAALFALHPIQAEAVAWAAARKDLLSSCFALASMIAYLRYADRKARRMLFLSIALFLCGLLSKVGIVLLPGILLLFDVWQGRTDVRRMITEKIPYTVLAVLFVGIALAGKTGAIGNLSIVGTSVLSVISIGLSLFHIAVPHDLSPMYPFLSLPQPFHPAFLASAAFIVVLCVAIAFSRKTTRIPALCAGIFLLFLAPSFVTFSKGSTLFIVSDRYVYLAILGVLLFFGWLAERFLAQDHRRRTNIMMASAILLIVCALLTVRHAAIWHDSETFNRYIIETTPGDHRPHYNLGVALRRQGRDLEAVEQFLRAVELHPGNANAAIELNIMYVEKHGPTQVAEDKMRRIVKSFPRHPRALHTLGVLLVQREKHEEAAEVFERALAVDPLYSPARHALAEAYGSLGRYEDAVAQYRELRALDPAYATSISLPDL